jgi:branched-chain amino acid transport system permease protein
MRVFAAIVALGAALAAIPWLGLPPFYESFLYLVLHWIALATSWNILSGYSGYFSFGHGAFFGAGIYTTAALASRGMAFLWTLPLAALVPMLLALALGAVVFRVKALRGELFALVTLAVTFVIATLILNTPIDGGPGVYLSNVPLPKIGPSPASTLYLLALVVALATIAIAYALWRARPGAGLFAIHDDEDVAEVVGVPTYRVKLGAFALSSALAGIVGGVHAMFVSYVTVSETFSITVPLTVVLMSVLGGTRHWAGPAVGAAMITGLLYAFTTGDHALAGKAVFGAVLIAVILFMPEGVLGTALRRVARRRPEVMHGAGAHPAPAIAIVESPPPAPDTPRASDDIILVARDVRKSFHGVTALAGVDLTIRRGEILGLLGPNGSGKSTLINVISGHYVADAGEIAFEGRDIAHLAGHEIAHAGIARTYQIPRPFAHLTVRDNVALAAMFAASSPSPAAAAIEARRALEFTGLVSKADALPDALNLHQRKLLELARALASRPRLLLLDEVLSGLTPTEIESATAVVRSIRDAGATIVFVEHVMRAVMALTDRVVVLDQGRVIAEGTPSTVMQQDAVVTAFLGRAHA